MRKTIKIKYHNKNLKAVSKIEQGDWIDLRAAQDINLQAGQFKLIPLGVSIKLPRKYEAHIVPRSSTFKSFGIIQTNHCGVIDETYCGNNDQWFFPAYALRDTKIQENDRICQFRIVKKQPEIKFITIDQMTAEDRGGYGSTGKK